MSGNICDLSRISKLGGGIPGGQPLGGLLGGGAGSTGGSGMEGGSTRGRNREELRTGFGRFYCSKNKKVIITPFRQAYNAGDLNGTKDNRILPGLYGPNPLNNNLGPASSLVKFGHVRGIKTGGGSEYTGNPRFVYDGSDYVRFKRLVAKNKTYNDSSFGGSNNGSYVPLMRVR